MASSTTRPMASTRPKSESVLIENPNIGKKANVPMSETGTAMSGMSVARQPCRKMKTTSDDEEQRLDQRLLDLVHARADGQRGVERDGVVHVGRETLAHLGHELLRAVGRIQRVGAGELVERPGSPRACR